jgi:hypothetical protein
MPFVKLEAVSLAEAGVTEKQVQDQIRATPSILGLGELEVRDYERVQPRAGRLDLLLVDPDTLKRHEVEIQLGATDESHIIRTVEYWDIERKRYPQYEHVAVIVAEDITSRFLNVIQLFNGTIPLIALKMSAYKVGNDYALTFVRVVDERTLGLVGVDEPTDEPADRASWEEYAGKQRLAETDELLNLVREVQPKAALKYTKNYIGIQLDGVSRNFVTFIPYKTRVNVRFTLSKEQGDQMKAQIEAANLHVLAYDAQYETYGVRIDSLVDEKQRTVLKDLIQQAWDWYNS